MGEWKDGVIQTGVDKLMEYLRKEREVRVDEAADSLGVEPKTIITWAKSLQDSGLAELRYTARSGRILRVAEDESKTEDVMGDVQEDIVEGMEQIADLGREKARLDRFQDILSRLEKHLSEDESFAEELREKRSDAEDTLDELEAFIDDLDTVEEDVSDLKKHLDQLQQDIGVLTKLDALREKASEPEGQGEQEQEETSAGTKISPLYPLKKLASVLSFRSGKSPERVCEDCGKEFDTEQGLHTHQRLTGHSGVTDEDSGSDVSDGESVSEVAGETFKCPECDKVFDSLRGIQTHMGMAHDEKYPVEEETA